MLSRFISNSVIRPLAVGRELLRGWRTRLAVKWVQHRYGAAVHLAESRPTEPVRTRLLAVVTSITPEDPTRQELAAERLRQCLRGLASAFAHTELRIVINTLPGREPVGALPEWAQSRVEIVLQPGCAPMLLEFRVQDIFAARRDAFDWFLFVEDDLVFHDPSFLDKLAAFNDATGDPRLLLLPNRYEFFAGVKRYIDLHWNAEFREVSWSGHSALAFDGARFAQCSNPHAATHCLSRAQLDLWLASPRRLRDQISGATGLESAATVCLMEAFELYKPYRTNLEFLEVEHWDQRYSQVLAAREAGGGMRLPRSQRPAD